MTFMWEIYQAPLWVGRFLDKHVGCEFVPGAVSSEVALCGRGSWNWGWQHLWLGQRPPNSSPVLLHPHVVSRAGPVMGTGVRREPGQFHGGEAGLGASWEVRPWAVAQVRINRVHSLRARAQLKCSLQRGRSPYWCCVSSSFAAAWTTVRYLQCNRELPLSASSPALGWREQ